MIETRPSRPADAPELLDIWCRSVDATHHFLSSEDRAAIEVMVADYVKDAPLIVALEGNRPVAFIGVTGSHIDALFVDPDAHRKGIGRQLVGQISPPVTVDVNEQNSDAVAFYARLGFVVTGRSERDDQGRPYPLLHLRLG